MIIKTHGLQLNIEVGDSDAGGWRPALITGEVPGFSYRISMLICNEDLQAFCDSLASLEKSIGKAHSETLSTTEPGLSLALSMNERGQIEGTYKLENWDSPGRPTLSGEFTADQTYLAEWQRDFRNLKK